MSAELVLSVDQPYATAIMLGLKRYETRPSPPNGDMRPPVEACHGDADGFATEYDRSDSSRERYRCNGCGRLFSRLTADGELFDHTRPRLRGLPGARVNRGDRILIASTARPTTERAVFGDYEAYPADPPGKVHPNHTAERPQRLYWNGEGWVGLMAGGDWWPLPLGCILGSVTVTDAYPILSLADPGRPGVVLDLADDLLLVRGHGDHLSIADQRPWGDWTPGRWAWALADPEPLPEPIPVTGKQGVWRWDAAAVAQPVTPDPQGQQP